MADFDVSGTSNDEGRAAGRRVADPYSILAAGYDFVMSHVEYEVWAQYIHTLIRRHSPEARTILELGCGTGSLALALQPMGSYCYAATDLSEDMIAIARRKADEAGADIQFELADFTDFRVDTPVDVQLLLYDGLNYLMDLEAIRDLFGCCLRALLPGGIFIVDQSTPSNSINNEAYFRDRDSLDDFSYVRESRYDRHTRIHRTTLEMTIQGKTFVEEHLQRAYEMAEIQQLADEAGFEAEAAYENFSTSPAVDTSERIHWVLRKPAAPAS